MANRKNTLIHLHGTTDLADGTILNAGEIAVKNAEEGAAKLFIRDNGDGVITFIDTKAVNSLITTAKSAAASDAKNKADQALADAKAYTNTREEYLQGQIDDITGEEGTLAAAVEEVKGYAEQKASAAQAAAINAAASDATTKANKALTDAQAYADGKKTEAIDAAATDATTKANAALASAKTYAEQQASAAQTAATNAAASDATTKANKALEDAQAYADSKKTEAINAAATDATTKANAAQAAAEEYADGLISAEVTRSNKYADDAKTAAISAAATDATTKANAAQAAAISAAATDATTKANAAQAAAEATAASELKKHTDDTIIHITSDERAKWNQVVTDLNDFLTGTDTDDVVNKLSDIKEWMEGEGVVATELTAAVAAEAKLREEADNGLSQRIAAFEGTGANSVSGQIATAKQQAIDAAAADATTKANAALADAKTYAEQQASAAQTAAATDAKNKADKALEDAQAYADSKKTEAINAAATDAQTKANAAQTAATNAAATDATTKANKALADAKAYADGKKTEAINAAATDATTKANAAQAAAEEYADGLISAEVTRSNKYADDAKTAAISAAATDATTKADAAQAAAITAAATDATTKANKALADAKAYADGKVKGLGATETGTGKTGIAVTVTQAQGVITGVSVADEGITIDCGTYDSNE